LQSEPYLTFDCPENQFGSFPNEIQFWSILMAKILRGRIAGRYGMESQTAQELYAWSDRFECRARFSDKWSDPGWLRRWSKRLRCLAEQKEKAHEHKTSQARVGRIIPKVLLEF
jgi:hypothetical protein